MENVIRIFKSLILHHRYKEVLIIYILLNLGVLFTISGSILYTPAVISETEMTSTEDVRTELMNDVKGAFIVQDYEIEQYNIGFDLLNFGGIFLIVGTLILNYIIAPKKQNVATDLSKDFYQLRKNGFLKGNIIEWICMILFLFAFFTFFKDIYFYIILTSFIIGLIGYAIRKLQLVKMKKQWTV